MKNFVAFTFGYTAVGKSTIAKKIAGIPNTKIFHSAVIRKQLNLTPQTPEEADNFFDYRNNLREKVDRLVYSKLTENAESALRRGKNVVLDAGYFFSWQRQMVYGITQKFGAELFIIKVKCDDELEIKKRLYERKMGFNSSPLNETPSWNTYLATKQITEPLEKDNFGDLELNILEYDTIKKKLSFLKRYSFSERTGQIERYIL
ncbi:hypothetical protein A3K82_00410 [Candidatus Pacearchaeota archaeon RBG_19FT_COMBO_34_9]|nr:MAG: hypothetical protein A3K82_00410 [Candidatus Pacearchaeota archaeon RBG_19FT_COMBO_34_9]OGJ16228.1 MAG: hypothetical protein A3K74_03315 [Candidatus Pacearchaeota archaeon RBG_13_33_26]